MTGTWSGGNPATSDNLTVNDEFGPLIGDLSTYSAQTPASLEYKPGAIGRMAGGNSGGLGMPIGNLILRGTSVEHTQAANCTNADIGPGNKLYTISGTTGTVTQDGGNFESSSSAAITNYINAGGGESTIEDDGTKGTLFKAMSGRHLVKKEFANYDIGGDAYVTIDLDDSISVHADTQLDISGGSKCTVVMVNGAIPHVYGDGGRIDNRKARNDFEIGATNLVLIGVRVDESPRVTMSNASSPGAMDRPVSAPVSMTT